MMVDLGGADGFKQRLKIWLPEWQVLCLTARSVLLAIAVLSFPWMGTTAFFRHDSKNGGTVVSVVEKPELLQVIKSVLFPGPVKNSGAVASEKKDDNTHVSQFGFGDRKEDVRRIFGSFPWSEEEAKMILLFFHSIRWLVLL